MKSKINKQYLIDWSLTAIFLLAMELIFRLVEQYKIISWATLRIFLGIALVSLVWNGLGTFFRKRKTKQIWNFLLLAIFSIYSLVQAGFLNFLGLFVSLSTSSQAGAVTSYLKDYILSIPMEYYLILIPFLFYGFYIFFPKQKEISTNDISVKTTRLHTLISFLLLACLYSLTLHLPFMQNSLQLIPNDELFHYPSNSSIAVNQFGTTMYSLLDIKLFFLPYEDKGISSSFEEESKKDTNRTIDDTAWKKLMETTTDKTYQNLNNYFISRTITSKNEQTGKFEDKNLIILMLESVNTTILKSEYFPNLAKMLDHGWYFENNYSPRNSCATINNEMSGLISLYPINLVCTANIYKQNTYFTSLFNQFKMANYYVSSYHDYDENYYNRHEIHKNMGSEKYLDVTDLNFPYDPYYAEWPNDAEFMEQIAPLFASKKRFFSWFTTVSAHQPYSEPSILGDLYYDLFDDTEYTESAKRYLSKLKVTDDALGVLMNELEKTNQLENTVIVLYGDHYPYALKDEDLVSLLGEEVLEKNEREKTPFLIYNPSLEKKVFKQYTFQMNIAPTLLNLFNIDYDPRLYLGEDIFDSNFSNRVVYSDGSWESPMAYYDASTSSIEYFTEERLSTEELKKINTDVTNKIRMSNLAITNNYFQYLEEGLKTQTKGDKND